MDEKINIFYFPFKIKKKIQRVVFYTPLICMDKPAFKRHVSDHYHWIFKIGVTSSSAYFAVILAIEMEILQSCHYCWSKTQFITYSKTNLDLWI